MKKGLYITPKYSIVILLFLFGLKGFSQTDKVYFIPDSLNGKSYKELFNSGNKEPDKKLFYAKFYLHRAKNEKDTIKMAHGYSQYIQASETKIEIKYADSIIGITNHINHHVYPGYAYMVKGMNYYYLSQYNKAVSNFLIAQEYAIKNNNEQHLSYINNGIGEIKLFWGDYNEAISHFKLRLNYLTRNNKTIFDKYNYFITLKNLSNCHIQLKQLDSAIFYNREGLKESAKRYKEFGDIDFVKQSGYILYYKNNFKAALDSINKGAVYDNSPNNYINTNYYKGEIYNKLNDSDKAFYYFKKADSLYNIYPEDIIPEVRNVQEYLLKYYNQKGDFINQLKHVNKLLVVDSILDSYKKNLNQTIEKEYDRPRLLAEKQTIIDNLEKDNKQSNYAIWGLIGLSALIVILTVRFYYLQRQYKTRFNTLIQDTTKENTLEKTEIKDELEGVSEHIITSVLNQLKTFEDEVQFLDKTITLANLAKRFNTNSSYLSKIVNHYNGKNFNSYLTELRINHCIVQLQTNKTLRTYTIKAIAEEVGFKNSESFSKAFFKTTGIYPSYFVKQIEKQEKII